MMRGSNAPSPKRSAGLQQQGSSSPVARFWQRSYAPDYLGFTILLAFYLLIQFYAEPFHRLFSLDNLAISFPHAEQERVPVSWLFVYAGGVPLLILVFWALLFRPGGHKIHVTILGLFISLILTSFITDVIKNAVGRPRPDLIARCKPVCHDPDIPEACLEGFGTAVRTILTPEEQEKGTPEHKLVNYTVCTETDHHTLHDGWRSFPSGHSSFSWAGLGYLSLFFVGQCHVFRPRTDLARVLLALLPLLGAALIAISRCEDYRHDVYDVTVGGILGMMVGWFTYRRYYPPLRSRHCDRPYPSRAEVADLMWSAKFKDEEAQIRRVDLELDELEDEDDERLPLQNRPRT